MSVLIIIIRCTASFLCSHEEKRMHAYFPITSYVFKLLGGCLSQFEISSAHPGLDLDGSVERLAHLSIRRVLNSPARRIRYLVIRSLSSSTGHEIFGFHCVNMVANWIGCGYLLLPKWGYVSYCCLL